MRRVSVVSREPATPILPDTDAETSIDLDKSVSALQESKKTNFTRTIFEVTIKDLEKHRISNEFKPYEAQLRQEIKDWKIYITQGLADLKKAKENPPVVNCSVLPKEKRDFLEQAPDMTRLLRRMRDFRSLAIKFIENDYHELLHTRQNLSEACRRPALVKKENFIAKRLANYK